MGPDHHAVWSGGQYGPLWSHGASTVRIRSRPGPKSGPHHRQQLTLVHRRIDRLRLQDATIQVGGVRVIRLATSRLMGADTMLLLTSASHIAKHRGRPVSNAQLVAIAIAFSSPQPWSNHHPNECFCNSLTMTGRRGERGPISHGQQPQLASLFCHRTATFANQCVRPCMSADISTAFHAAIMVSNRKRRRTKGR